MNLLITLVSALITVFLADIQLTEYFHDDGDFRYYPNKQRWEFILLRIVSWAAGLLQAVVGLVIMFEYKDSLSLFSITVIHIFSVSVIAAFSPLPFMMVHETLKYLIKQKKLCEGDHKN
jgi:cytochrome bd-type quinol oxidase subunit 2